MIIRIAFLLILAISPSLCLAQSPAAESEAEIERSARESPKTSLPRLIDFLEAKLERIYNEKLQQAAESEKKVIETSQRAWKAFYEADRAAAALDSSGGSGSAVFLMQRRIYQIRLRIYQLQVPFEQGWPAIPEQK